MTRSRSKRCASKPAGTITAGYLHALLPQERSAAFLAGHWSRNDIVAAVRLLGGGCPTTNKQKAALALSDLLERVPISTAPVQLVVVSQAPPPPYVGVSVGHPIAESVAREDEAQGEHTGVLTGSGSSGVVEDDSDAIVESADETEIDGLSTTGEPAAISALDTNTLCSEASVLSPADFEHGVGGIAVLHDVGAGELASGACTTRERSSKAFAHAIGSAMLGEITYEQAFRADKGRAILLARDPVQYSEPAFDAMETAQFARDMGLGSSSSDTDHHQTFEAACGFKLTAHGQDAALARVAKLRSATPSQVRKALLSAARSAQSEERCRQLAQLHPPARESDLIDATDCDVSEVEAWSDEYLQELLEKAAQRGKAGKAVGPDGVSHRVVLMLVADTRSPLVHLLRKALTDSLNADETSLLTSATLLAIPKESGGSRPIAIGGGISRLFARVFHSLGKDRWAMASSGNFCGVSDGAVAACQVLRHAFDTHEAVDAIVIALDCSNAFNTVSRAMIHKQVKAVTPELEAMFISLYGEQGKLFYHTSDNRYLCLSSQQGVPQGSAASSALFSLAIASSIEKTRALYPSVLIIAYADDVSLVGASVETCKAAGCLARLLASEAGLKIKPAKTQIMCKPLRPALEYVKARVTELVGESSGECISADIVQNSSPIRVLGGCVSPSEGLDFEEARSTTSRHHMSFSLALLRSQYGDGLELLQRAMDELGPVGAVHYVASVLTPSLSYVDRAAGLSQFGSREKMHAMICHALVIRSLNIQVDPFLSCGVIHADDICNTEIVAKERFRLMRLIDLAIGDLLGLSHGEVEPGEPITWSGPASRLAERDSFLELFATCPDTMAVKLRPTPHRDLRAEGTYSKRFTRSARLGLQAGGLGIPGAKFFVNAAMAGWLGVIAKGVRGGLDTDHLTAKQLELKEQAPAGHEPVCGTVEGDVYTIADELVEPPDPDPAEAEEGRSLSYMQPSDALASVVTDGAARYGVGLRVMEFLHRRAVAARQVHREALEIAYLHNGANMVVAGGAGSHRPGDPLSESILKRFSLAKGAAALDKIHEDDPVFGKDSWLAMSKLQQARMEERRAFGKPVITSVAGQVVEHITEGIPRVDEQVEMVEAIGIEDTVAQIVHEIDLACKWRLLILTLTGQIRTTKEYLVDKPLLNGHFGVLSDEVMERFDTWLAKCAGSGLMKSGPDTKVQWLKILLASDTNVDRVSEALPLVREYSAMVEAIRVCDGDGETMVTEQEIAESAGCIRMMKRLAHMRDNWQPASATWLRRLVSKGQKRLSDDSFVTLLRYRLAASRCNDLIRPGEEIACGCAMAEPLHGDGDVSTQFHLARCAKGRSRTIAWHHGIKHALARMLKSLKLDVKTEPTDYAPGDEQFAPSAGPATNRRPDLHVSNKLTGLSSLVDVTVTAVTNATSCMAAFRNPTRPLEAAAKRKHTVYANSPNTEHFMGELVPFVVNSNGILGAEAYKWLRKVSGPILERQTKVEARRWRFFWFSYLSEACATGLASQLLSQTSRLEAQVGRARRTTIGTMGAEE